MSFLRRMARDIAGEVTQSASNAARNRGNDTRTPQSLPRQTTHVPQRTQPQPVRSESVLEGAFAGLIGSAERFIDNVGRLIGTCPNCQTAAPANTTCEKCGTHVPAATAYNPAVHGLSAGEGAAHAGPRNCNNCGAPMQGNICEYCTI